MTHGIRCFHLKRLKPSPSSGGSFKLASIIVIRACLESYRVVNHFKKIYIIFEKIFIFKKIFFHSTCLEQIIYWSVIELINYLSDLITKATISLINCNFNPILNYVFFSVTTFLHIVILTLPFFFPFLLGNFIVLPSADNLFQRTFVTSNK